MTPIRPQLLKNAIRIKNIFFSLVYRRWHCPRRRCWRETPPSLKRRRTCPICLSSTGAISSWHASLMRTDKRTHGRTYGPTYTRTEEQTEDASKNVQTAKKICHSLLDFVVMKLLIISIGLPIVSERLRSLQKLCLRTPYFIRIYVFLIHLF